MTTARPKAQRERGRPRDPETDRAILDAALRLMSRKGYRGTSVDAIAAEAGVGKPTIYLRFPTKADIATAAVAELKLRDLPKETGDLRRDLLAQVRHLRRNVERTVGMAFVGTLLAEEADHPKLIANFRQQVVRPRREAITRIIQGGVYRGELAPDTPVEEAVEQLVGSYYARYIAGKSFSSDWPERSVDLLLRGVQPRARPTGRPRAGA